MFAMSIKVADLFSGAGLFSEGWKQAGFDIVLANEINEPFARIYKENNKETRMIDGDIRTHKDEICSFLKQDDVQIVMGCFPCQSFSMSGMRDPNDDRGFLYKDMLDVINVVRPKIFVCENVKGILSSVQIKDDLSVGQQERLSVCRSIVKEWNALSRLRSQNKMTEDDEARARSIERKVEPSKKSIQSLTEPVIDKIQRDIASIGYKCRIKILNAAHFGVPQFRERVFIVGFDDRVFNPFPDRDHYSRKMLSAREFQVTSLLEDDVRLPYVTAKQAIGDLENKEEDADFFHVFSKNSGEFLEKIRKTTNGESVYGNYKEAFYRIFPNVPSPTVKENHSGVFLHYSLDRLLSPRELGRLQSIPDTFRLAGTKRNVLTAIANGVPVLLARRIAEKIGIEMKEIL